MEHSSYVFYSLLLSLGSADSWKFCFTSSLYLFHFCICLCHNRVHCRRAVFDYTLSRVHVCWINTGRWELRTMRFLQCIFVATLRLRVVMIVTVVGCTVGGEHTLFCYLSFFFCFSTMYRSMFTRALDPTLCMIMLTPHRHSSLSRGLSHWRVPIYRMYVLRVCIWSCVDTMPCCWYFYVP